MVSSLGFDSDSDSPGSTSVFKKFIDSDCDPIASTFHNYSLTMVYDQKSGKPRGYAFIEYEDERDARKAYKEADGKKIDGRRVMVDVERGSTYSPFFRFTFSFCTNSSSF